MSLLNPYSVLGLSRAVREPRRDANVINLKGFEATPEERFLRSFAENFVDFAKGASALEKQVADNNYVQATPVAHRTFRWNLARHLQAYYASDGSSYTPAEGELIDLGEGITLSRDDFFDDGNKRRRSYTEVYEKLDERFVKARKDSAPSLGAVSKVTPVMLRESLQGKGEAWTYQGLRQGRVFTNKLNATVLAYKQQLAESRGFDPEPFGLYAETLLGLTKGVDGAVDRGQANLALKAALHDLLAVGVTDAFVDKDNQFALSVLANSTDATSDRTKRAVSGLSPRDREYLNYAVGKAKSGSKKYSPGEKPPSNRNEYFLWALAQMSGKQKEDLQARAIKGFAAQTQMAREELNSRLQGLASAAWTPQMKDAGMRQMIESSVEQTAALVNRIYPRKLFPVERAKALASLAIVNESLNTRKLFDETHTSNLSQAAQKEVARISEVIQKKVPAEDLAHTLDLQQEVHKNLTKYVAAEYRARQQDPFGSIVRTTKDVRELDKKLRLYDYSHNIGEKYRDQNILRQRVEQRSFEIGVPTAFMSATEKATLKGIAGSGNRGVLYAAVDDLKDRYGETVFHDYILPEITQERSVGEQVSGAFLIEDAQVREKVKQAQVNEGQNDKLLKAAEADIGELQAPLALTEDAPFWFTGDQTSDMGKIYNYIEDRLGTGAKSAHAKTAVQSQVRALAKQYIVDGYKSKAKDALTAAVAAIKTGIGKDIKLNERGTLVPESFQITEPQLAHLQTALYEDAFLRKKVFPYIKAPPLVVNLAEVKGVPVETIMLESFKAKDVVGWRFSFEGLRPVIPDPVFPDIQSAIPRADGGGTFYIPYSEIPAIILGEY